jgi:predicted DNA-binding transcriptional regulator YafY
VASAPLLPASPEFEERIISPHTLIYDGSRWHVRAWCEKNQGYRDFVLTRIREVFGIEGSSQYGLELDKGWNTWVDLSIEPDPRLNEARRNIVAMDYGMSVDTSEKLRRTYRVREALVIYWLQQLRLDRYNDRAEVQQIVLSDTSLADAERWIR